MIDEDQKEAAIQAIAAAARTAMEKFMERGPGVFMIDLDEMRTIKFGSGAEPPIGDASGAAQGINEEDAAIFLIIAPLARALMDFPIIADPSLRDRDDTINFIGGCIDFEQVRVPYFLWGSLAVSPAGFEDLVRALWEMDITSRENFCEPDLPSEALVDTDDDGYEEIVAQVTEVF